MVAKTRANLVVRYIDGNSNSFAFVREDEDPQSLVRLDEAIKAQILFLELSDHLMAIPFHNIKSIEVYPKPKRAPRYSIRNVRLLS
jgi:hypothetical protein